MIASAVALRPLLRELGAATEAANRIHPDVHDRCMDAGFYRLLQPRCFGGYEFDLPTFARVMIEIAAGCASTGWAVAFTAGHIHVLGKFSEATQTAVYGLDGDVRAPLVEGQISSTATPVEGGYRVTGTHDNSSGIDISTHFFGFSKVKDVNGNETGQVLVLLDRDEYEIERNWNMLGMMGTGSHRTVVVDQFVALDRAPNAAPTMGATTPPDQRFLNNSFFVGPSFNVLMTEISSVAIGAGYGVLDEYERVMQATTVPRTTNSRAADREYLLYYGEAFAMLETAKAALIQSAEQYMQACDREIVQPGSFDQAESWRIALIAQRAIRIVGDATNILFRSAGSSPFVPGKAMNRWFRDVSTLLTHVTLSYDRWAERAARLHFGLE